MTNLFDNLIILNILQFISSPGNTCVFGLVSCPQRLHYIVCDIFLGKTNNAVAHHIYLGANAKAQNTQILKDLPASATDKKEVIELINNVVDLNKNLTSEAFCRPNNIITNQENKAIILADWLGLSISQTEQLIEASIQKHQFSYSLPKIDDALSNNAQDKFINKI